MIVHERQSARKRVRADECVRVQHEHVAPRHVRVGEVVGADEPEVGAGADDRYFGILRLDELGCAVGRAVVDEEDLLAQVVRRSANVLEALVHELGHVPGYDDDRDVVLVGHCDDAASIICRNTLML